MIDFVKRAQYWATLLTVVIVLGTAVWMQLVLSEAARGWWPSLPYPTAPTAQNVPADSIDQVATAHQAPALPVLAEKR